MLTNFVEHQDEFIREGKIKSYKVFNVLNDFSIIVNLNILKPAFVQLSFDDPKFNVSAKITKMQLDLNKKIYGDLLTIGKIFEATEAVVSQIQTEKKGLLVSNTKYGVVIRGKPLIGFSTSSEFAIVSQGRIYFFKDKKSHAAYDYFSLKGVSVKQMEVSESGQPYAIKIGVDKSRETYLAFEEESNMKNWMVALETEAKKLRIEARKNVNYDQATKTAEEDSAIQSRVQQKKKTKEEEGTAHDYVAKVDLKMEEVELWVYDENEIKMFDLSITKLKVMVDHKDLETAVEVSLLKININDLKENDQNLRALISSEIGKSIATQVKGLGVDSDQISKTLVSIKLHLIDPKNPKYSNVDTDIDIKFGSLFINIRPSLIHNLMVFFIPKSGASNDEADDKVQETKRESIAAQEQNKIAIQRKKSTLLNIEDDKVAQLKVKFSLEKISVIMINEIHNIYLAHASISAINIEFISKTTGIALTGTLSNLQLHDLTNYPNTLTTWDFSKIVPNELFGISFKEGKENETSLINLGFNQYNATIVNLPEENVSGGLNVTIEKIKINFFMQVIMRILDFVLSHLLPALSVDDEASKPQNSPDQEDKLAARQIAFRKEVLLDNLKNPFWMKMNVNISKPTILIKCNPDSKEYLQVELGKIGIINKRILSKSRIIKSFADSISKSYGFGEVFEGIWSEVYYITMDNLSIKKITHVEDKKIYQYFMHPFNFNLSIDMAQYPDSYKNLFFAELDPSKAYIPYSLNEKKLVYLNENSQYKLYYDSGMMIRARISPMITIFGNREFNFLMKTLFHNVTFNDFQDVYFVKEFEKKKVADEQKKAEEGGSPMSISIDIDYIALVAMDTQEIEPFRINESVVLENRIAYAKLYIKELRVDMLMHSSGDMDMGLYKRSLNASYLESRNPDSKALDFYEKGFIGKMSIFKEYKAENCEDLRTQIIKYLEENVSEKGEAGSFGLTEYSKDGLVLELMIAMKSD